MQDRRTSRRKAVRCAADEKLATFFELESALHSSKALLPTLPALCSAMATRGVLKSF